jgi:hypothetical protein
MSRRNKAMTPPIGFRINKKGGNENSTVMEIRPVAATTDAAATLTAIGPTPSTISDYAYRIAALTAGIALLASIW